MLNRFVAGDVHVPFGDIGHFTRTADSARHDARGLSQHLRKLEQQWGQPLICVTASPLP